MRPQEHGSQQTKDLKAEEDWDYVVEDFIRLAERLGC
jgi:2-haloacid dehalogenase